MSSYHNSFSYLNKNSKDDFGWVIASFEPDAGESDSYLSQDQVYTDSSSGRKRILYGTRWNSVATVKVTVVKQNGRDFSVAECRSAYRWLTGNPQASWLDLYSNGEIKYSFLVTTQDVRPYKMDARTVGLVIYFESLSPWAYSTTQHVRLDVFQEMSIDENNVLQSMSEEVVFDVDDNGVLYNSVSESVALVVSGDGVLDVNGTSVIKINNQTDDLYSHVYLDTVITNITSDYVSIQNLTLGEETLIRGLDINETVTIGAEQFIVSDKPNKTFGNTFNFVWPRLAPGVNDFVVNCSGETHIDVTYRYPIKIGDCAIDLDVASAGGICDIDYGSTGTISWDQITDTPTTLEGYGITNAYNMVQIDNKIQNIDATIDEEALNEMLDRVLD